MGMFSRMTDIIQANINAMLDKAEDPKKVIRLIIQEMEETLVEVRSVTAKHLSEKKALARKQATLQRQVDSWQTNAQLAVDKGREDLARAALTEKHEAQNSLAQLDDEIAQVDEAITSLQEDTARLHEKLADAKAKQRSLEVRQSTAKVRIKAKTQERVHKIDEAITRFESYERRIDDLEAQVDAYDVVKKPESLEAQFKQLAAQEQIEDELAALRASATKKVA